MGDKNRRKEEDTACPMRPGQPGTHTSPKSAPALCSWTRRTFYCQNPWTVTLPSVMGVVTQSPLAGVNWKVPSKSSPLQLADTNPN